MPAGFPVERGDEAWKNAVRLIVCHGSAALPLAAREMRERLASGQYRSLVAWARIALLVAVMLDAGVRQRYARNELDRVLDKVTRRLREAGH